MNENETDKNLIRFLTEELQLSRREVVRLREELNSNTKMYESRILSFRNSLVLHIGWIGNLTARVADLMNDLSEERKKHITMMQFHEDLRKMREEKGRNEKV